MMYVAACMVLSYILLNRMQEMKMMTMPAMNPIVIGTNNIASVGPTKDAGQLKQLGTQEPFPSSRKKFSLQSRRAEMVEFWSISRQIPMLYVGFDK